MSLFCVNIATNVSKSLSNSFLPNARACNPIIGTSCVSYVGLEKVGLDVINSRFKNVFKPKFTSNQIARFSF